MTMTPERFKHRRRLTNEIMAATHRDFRSKRGDATHPSILWLEPMVGTTLVCLNTCSEGTLEAIHAERVKKVIP